MNIEEIREYCLAKPGVTEHFPFDEVTLVFKVMGKMFALTNLDGETTINLKCDPEKAIELREQHEDIVPGYHMSKIHWNTVYATRNLGSLFLKELIDESYHLVVESLPKKTRQQLQG
ncbi:MAG: MmcQ/YjbR family DNA-binding protein [Breznakibacter sp.]